MSKILFVGTFLSKQTGTKSISEKLKRDITDEKIKIKLVSNYKNKLFRILDITLATLFERYNKIHIDTFSGMAFNIVAIASKIASFRNKTIILTLRGGALPKFYIKNKKKVKKVLDRANYIQTPSLYLKDFFKKHEIIVNYLPNPINTEGFPYKRDKVKKHSLLWVRAFTKIYNPDLAIKALYEIKKEFPDSNLTMIGPDKGLLKQIKKLIKDLNLNDSIKIIGPVDNDELYKYYQTHHIFLNTTSYESFGVAVVEAASCGIPIVSTYVGEIPYLWKHEENILLSAIEPKAFSKEINKILASKELERKLSKNARLKAKIFDWNVLKIKWIELLND